MYMLLRKTRDKREEAFPGYEENLAFIHGEFYNVKFSYV